MKRCLVPLVSLLAFGACNMNVRVNPEGHRCDVANACPIGYLCTDGVCRGQAAPCTGVVCDQVPAAECVGGMLRTFAGSCADGVCSYPATTTACAGGCSNGACTDVCQGVSCVTPPAASCASATVLRTFAATGTCNSASGACDYASTDVPCTNGCANNVCVGQNLCLGVTCTTPPAPVCVGNVLRTYAASGTCNMGTGQCDYAFTPTTCTGGCAAGACTTPALTFTQVGPRLPFPVNAIDIAPNSSGNLVLAVGGGGNVWSWDGAMWSRMATPSNSVDLNAVSFASGTTAWMVGSGRTVWVLRNGAIVSQALPGAGTQSLVDVYAEAIDNVTAVDGTGGWLRWNGATWTPGTLPVANGPYEINQVYIDPVSPFRERLAGRCNGRSCTGYRNPSFSTNFSMDLDTTAGAFTAVGPWVDAPAASGADGLVGLSPLTLRRINVFGGYSSTEVPALGFGSHIVGITGAPISGITRSVFVQTGSATNGGELYRLTRGTTGVTATRVLETYFGEEHLSRGESGGVVVAEVRRPNRTNNIFRRGLATDDCLDVGEDLVGASFDPSGRVYYASNLGDVIRTRPASAVMDFKRGPYIKTQAMTASNGTGALLVGQNGGTSTDGALVHFTPPDTFVRIALTPPNTTFRAVCRASDTQAFAVGTGGTIARISGTTAALTPSGTTRELLGADCAGAAAVACGDNGTVLRWSGSAWAPVTPAFPGSNRLTDCKLVNGAIVVAGDNVFARLDTGAAAWTTLPGFANLRSLVVRAPNDIYGAAPASNGSQTDLARFDGAAWTRLTSVTGVLGGGSQTGAQVVFAGTNAVIVEGR